MIDYRKKLTTHREVNEIPNIDGSIESDRGRIVTAPALRRLQKRTQVFPLELNAAVRSRLTHSLEVQQSARYISKTILNNIKKEGKLDEYGLGELENAFVSTAEMTSLLHDIGNPPFGHFAEMSINSWMKNKGVEYFNRLCPDESELKSKLIEDICNFDGNAQAIRVVTKLQRLNLSYTQIASLIKYTRAAYEPKPSKDDTFSYLKKKPGFYYSEEEFVKKLSKTLEIEQGCRFPITYIMEAADDISYLNADLEDAVDKGILSFDEIYTLIKTECEKADEGYLLEIVEKFYKRVKEKEDEPYQFNLFLTLTRAKLTTDLVYHVVDLFMKNHQALFDGTFNDALLEHDKKSKYSKAVNILQDISNKYIYNNKDVQTLELKGYAIINGLFDAYRPLLELTYEEMQKLLKDERIDCFISMRLFKRLSSKHIVAYRQSVEAVDDENEKDVLEWYYRARLIIDYISGMTDDFALNEYRTLLAMK